MNITKKNVLFLIISCLLTLGIFSYLFKTISLSDVKQVLKELDFRFIIAFIILSLLGTFFRTWRYLLTLRPAGFQPAWSALFLVTLVRNMCSDLLPARIGSAIYIYLANTRLGIPVAIATNSFALSLLFDLVALGPLVALALLFAGPEFPISRSILLLCSIFIFLVTLLLVLFLPVLARLSGILISKIPLLPSAWKTNLNHFARQVAYECETTRRHGTFFNIFMASCFVRLCKYGSLYVFLVGMLLPLGFAIDQISPIVCTVGILAAEMAASLPISGIAGFGVYEGAWAFTFAQMGFSADIAQLTAVAHHLFTQVWGYGLGLVALAGLMLPIIYEDSKPSTGNMRGMRFVFCAQCSVFILGLALVFAAFRLPENKPTVLTVESKPKLAEADKRSLAELAETLPGKLYFDSNRSGTFGIYSVTTDGSVVTPVIDEPHWHEMYPDIAPDGQTLVYARSRSLARQAPAEVWLANIDGSQPRRLAAKASFPTFSANGKTVYLELERQQVGALNLETNDLTIIFPGKRKAFRGRQIIKPRISPDGSSIAMTVDNPSRWHAWWAPLKRKEGPPSMIAAGCEPAWFPDSNKLAVMKKTGARAGSGIMYYDRNSKQYDVLKDDAGPLGHEYFPTVTADGRFLLYSACPEDQHDHLTANYSIFVHDLQKDKTWQVTFDQSTNRWPKYAPR